MRRVWAGAALLVLLAGASCKTNKKPEAKPAGEQSGRGEAGSTDSVKIPKEGQNLAGIQLADVTAHPVQRTLSVAGQVVMDEKHTSHLGTLADGRITSVAVLPGAMVRAGQVLGGLHSHMVHETAGALTQAFAAVERQRGALVFAKQAQDRYHHLYSIQAASLEESQRAGQEVLQAEKQLADAQSNVHMEREHLSELLQVPAESLNASNVYYREIVPMRAPISGVVISRNVTVGQVVTTGFSAFDISDLSTVWVMAAVNQQDLALVRPGANADVVSESYANQALRGQVAMLGDALDPQTRTVPVRIVVPNPGTQLRPGMFVTASISEPATRAGIFIPEEALQEINGLRVVFVTRDGVLFKARTVNVGLRSAGKAEILEGLKAGERIVVKGAFMVKSEMLKSSMGDG